MEDPSDAAAANIPDASPAAAGAGTDEQNFGMLPPSAPSPQQLQQGVLPPRQQQLLGLQQQGSQPVQQPRYCKFYMQRVTTNVGHVLFYVVDEQGYAKLAVVGTDVKLSGHFVYASVSDMTEAPPLRCTNRGKVMEWLAALGATSPADDHEVVLPELAPHHWQQLHSADPTWSKPQLDRQYSGYREEVGTLPDGRHFKNYYLVDDSGAEKLMVIAEDGARLDRRYTYKAVEDVGGFCFENGKAVTDWLDFVLGKSELPPSFMRREAAPERKRKKTRSERGTPPPSQPRSSREARTHSYPQPAPMQQLLGSAPSGSLGSQSAYVQPEDSLLQQRQQMLLQQQQYPPTGRASSLYASPAADPLSNAELRGAPVAAAGYLGGGAPSMYAGRQQQSARAGVPAAAGAGYDGGGTAPGLEEPLSPRSMQEAVAAAGQEVRAVFSTDPDLLDWVTSMPDSQTVERVSQCAARLEMCVTESGDAQLVNEAYNILQLLCQTPVSLRLLELTGICRPVAMLSYHAQPQLREIATRLTQRWRRVATAAHDCASGALKAPMGGLTKLVT